MPQKNRQRDAAGSLSLIVRMGGQRMVYRLLGLLLAAVGIQAHAQPGYGQIISGQADIVLAQGLSKELPQTLDDATHAIAATVGDGSDAASQNALPAYCNPVNDADAASRTGLTNNSYTPCVSPDTAGSYWQVDDEVSNWIDYSQLGQSGFVVERKDGLALPNLLAPRTRDFVMLR